MADSPLLMAEPNLPMGQPEAEGSPADDWVSTAFGQAYPANDCVN